VQVALLNNPGLQATYAELGIAEADLVQAGRMTNPHFAYLRTSAGGAQKLEWALTFPIVDLLTMPLRSRIEGRRFEQVKLAVAGRMLDVATMTRNSWIDTVAAEERVRYLEQVKLASEASATLASRMEQAGNFNRLDRMREEVFHAETSAQLARARQAAVAGRERLTRHMGLSGGDAPFRLPERLPELPAGKPEFKEIEARAMTERLDVRAAALETKSLAGSLGLTRSTRFINVLEFGPAATKEDPEPWKRGFEVSLQLPVFDWGGARVAKAEAIYMQALHRVAEKIDKLLPDYMVMGERGMAEMGAMEMPLPDNTLPMMTGQGPFGPLEMGGMFTVVKIREGLARGDYKDPGWYRHPKGSVAYEWKESIPAS
jgi:outer membrane protein TolC